VNVPPTPNSAWSRARFPLASTIACSGFPTTDRSDLKMIWCRGSAAARGRLEDTIMDDVDGRRTLSRAGFDERLVLT